MLLGGWTTGASFTGKAYPSHGGQDCEIQSQMEALKDDIN